MIASIKNTLLRRVLLVLAASGFFAFMICADTLVVIAAFIRGGLTSAKNEIEFAIDMYRGVFGDAHAAWKGKK